MVGTRRCGVLGDPIAHSLSPVLHRAGYAALGLGWEYDAHRVGEAELPAFLASLDDSWRGLSLTMPLKRAVLPLADDLSETAVLAGAANTLVLGDRGMLADNTDVPGAAAALRERYDGPVRSATILGGGATAASTLLALTDLGCTSFRLLVRDAGRAAETLAVATRHPSTPSVEVAPLELAPAEGDVLVSTVPAAAQTPDLLARCAGVPVVFDVLYDPWPTPLATAASVSQQILVGGLDLLVHQAVLQFAAFTGQEAPLAAMRSAGELALAG
ncbi:shikimate dehydrogenase [Nocardioides speluncae]|uniref:shikimate dehydrogenase n=1 Tax=Nocardioides speluncae TaxID=2670337 RepID=UPI000D693D67|nr:shikimate dehydrogenase [Nocardioides speluncae]